MIRSMTGYGRAEGRHKGTPITVEVRSVNHRHSEVMAKLPRALQAHEDRIRDLVQGRVARGRVDVTVNFSGERDPGRGIVLDRALARRYHALLKELQQELGLKGSPEATLLASFRDVIRPAELAAEEPGAVREGLTRLDSHLDQFRAFLRKTEPVGRSLDFLLQEMNREINTIGSKVGDTVVTQEVVAVKAELEKIREQVQNVE